MKFARVHLLFMSGHQHQTMSNNSSSNNNPAAAWSAIDYNYNKKRKTRAFPGHVHSLIVQWATDVSACQMQTEMSQKKKWQKGKKEKNWKWKERLLKKFSYVGGKVWGWGCGLRGGCNCQLLLLWMMMENLAATAAAEKQWKSSISIDQPITLQETALSLG